MSYRYDYFIGASFPNGISEQLLARQVQDANLGQALLEVARSGDDVDIVFAAQLASKPALDAVVAAHDPTGYSFAKNYSREIYTAGRLQTHTWYAYKDADDAYWYKVEETTFTYDAANLYLTQEQLVTYDPMGNVRAIRTWRFVVVYEDQMTWVQREEVL